MYRERGDPSLGSVRMRGLPVTEANKDSKFITKK